MNCPPKCFINCCCYLVLFLMMSACEPLVLDANDPLENNGAYTLNENSLSIPHSTSATPLNARFYQPVNLNSPRPLVMVLPGFGTGFNSYDYYARHLASHGYRVVGMDYVETSADASLANHDDKAQQVVDAIDYILANYNDGIDANKVVILGHSLGGKLAFYAATLDARIKLIIALDPSNAGGPPCLIAPSQCNNYPVAYNPNTGAIGILSSVNASSVIFRSQADFLTNPDPNFNASYFYFGSDGNGLHGAPASSYYYDMGGVPHADYTPILITPTNIVVKRTALAAIQGLLEGVDTNDYLTGERITSDITAGLIQSADSRQ